MRAMVGGVPFQFHNGQAMLDGASTTRALEYNKRLVRDLIASPVDAATIYNYEFCLDPTAILFLAGQEEADGRVRPADAGFHAVWLTPEKAEVRGVITAPSVRSRGLATILLAWGLLSLIEYGAEDIGCQVRVYPAYWGYPEEDIAPGLRAPVNRGAFRLYRRLGFDGIDLALFPIKGDERDVHLIAIAEPRRADKEELWTYRSLIMRGMREQVTKAATAALGSVPNLR